MYSRLDRGDGGLLRKVLIIMIVAIVAIIIRNRHVVYHNTNSASSMSTIRIYSDGRAIITHENVSDGVSIDIEHSYVRQGNTIIIKSDRAESICELIDEDRISCNGNVFAK